MTKESEPTSKSPQEQRKEWKEHFGPMAEAQEAQEKREQFVEKMAEGKKVKKWREYFGPIAEIQEEMEKRAEAEAAKEQKSIQTEMNKDKAGGKADNFRELPPEEFTKKISSFAEIEKVGQKRVEKAAEVIGRGVEKGIYNLAALDKWGIFAFKGAGKLAVEAAGILGGVGLSPLLAIEEVGREVSGRMRIRHQERAGQKAGGEFLKSAQESWDRIIGKGVKPTDNIPGEKARAYQEDIKRKGLDFLYEKIRLAKEEADKARENLSKKGKLLSFISKLPFFKRFAE